MRYLTHFLSRTTISDALRWAPFGLALLLVAALAACAPATEEATEDATDASAADQATADATPVASGAGPWQVGDLTLRAQTDSPAFADAELQLMMPAEDETLEPGENVFHFEVANYELGAQTPDAETKGIANSGQGQHIHFILDNGPYAAYYEPHVETGVEAGRHVLLAFLSRSYHESVKAPGAYVLRELVVGDDAGDPLDLSGAHLFYSRPKGSYAGSDTENLMLDFFLVGTELSESGNKVRATINGEAILLPRWVPYVIQGLPLGEVTIQLELVDAEGNGIPGPFNSVTRTVTLEAGGDDA